MSPDPKQLAEIVKAEAHRLGFELVGITTPGSPAHLEVYESWLAAGRHGMMAYLDTERARQRRADPQKILPECRSILALGMRYPTPPPPETDTGRVASYAGGTDYHDLLPPLLAALVAFIEAQLGHPIPNRWYTDTGPILERDLAQRAGLGWIGKNTCLIHPRAGSYFLLAEILLGVELEPDVPFVTDGCGTCTRCLEACPTGCILPDRTLDARRCISYLTIELKGPIPSELRPQLGEWVFGCDVCQQVCPWNLRFAQPGAGPGLEPRPGLTSPDLLGELALTPTAFNLKFKDSPVRRAKRRGYLRNVAVALGNAAAAGRIDPATAVAALSRALHRDPEPLVRAHAAWALGQIADPPARLALESAAEQETDLEVLEEIRQALSGAS